jgi:hypothetical protein
MRKNIEPVSLSVSVFLILSLSATASADVVIDWNAAALEAIRANRTPPPIASRGLAILHASMYDAVNGLSARTSCTP